MVRTKYNFKFCFSYVKILPTFADLNLEDKS
jgi:hypothetical protein